MSILFRDNFPAFALATTNQIPCSASVTFVISKHFTDGPDKIYWKTRYKIIMHQYLSSSGGIHNKAKFLCMYGVESGLLISLRVKTQILLTNR